jgi:hypothetical protein
MTNVPTTARVSPDGDSALRVEPRGGFVVVATPDGREHALTLDQSTALCGDLIAAGNAVRRRAPGGAS